MALSLDALEALGKARLGKSRLVVFACAALSACALDTRTLSSDPDRVGAAGGEAGAAPSLPGVGGSVTPPDVEVPSCDYATSEPPSDCESLADNPGFAVDTSGWLKEPYSIDVSWDSSDARDSATSGSAVVSNTMPGTTDGIAPGGAMQCLPATPGATYVMAADVFIAEGQGEGIQGTGPFTGLAGLSILFWRGEGCRVDMPTLGSTQTELVSDTEQWKHVEATAVAPPGIGSLSIRMLTVKPFKQKRFQANFDNVLLQAR